LAKKTGPSLKFITPVYDDTLMTLCSKSCHTSIKHCFSSSTSWTWYTYCCISPQSPICVIN